MKTITTLEGYPLLLGRPTRRQFVAEYHLAMMPQPWIYLTQNPKGRWQVLTNIQGNTTGETHCIAGAPKAAMVLPTLVDFAREHGYVTKRNRKALFFFGAFVAYQAKPQPRG